MEKNHTAGLLGMLSYYCSWGPHDTSHPLRPLVYCISDISWSWAYTATPRIQLIVWILLLFDAISSPSLHRTMTLNTLRSNVIECLFKNKATKILLLLSLDSESDLWPNYYIDYSCKKSHNRRFLVRQRQCSNPIRYIAYYGRIRHQFDLFIGSTASVYEIECLT